MTFLKYPWAAHGRYKIDHVRPLHLLSRGSIVSFPGDVRRSPPENAEYDALARDEFRDRHLDVGGLVQNRARLTLDDLKRMPRESHVTKHHCIQGWTNIGEWTGVPLAHLRDQCEPLPFARYVVFHALDDKSQSEHEDYPPGRYYEVVDLDLAISPQTILG